MANDENVVSGFLGKLDGSQKLSIAVMLAVILGSVLFFYVTSSKRKMAVLYSKLNTGDANSIVSALSLENVPVELKDNGTTVMVPADEVYTLRMKLAAKGFPKGSGVGFEIFDKTDFGVTDFVQKVNYQRALSGELSRSISHLSEVESAKVHLAIPDKSLFVEKEKKATASVVLRVKQGASLKKSQVDGIVRLVASSIEGLSASGITVIDSHGNILSENFDENAPIQLTSSELGFQKELEKKLEKKVETMLNRVLGITRSVVRIHADLNFNQVEKTEEIFDPKTVVRSEERSVSETKGAKPAAKGVPGVRSNLGEEATEPVSTAEPATSSQETETINYDIGKTLQHTKMAYGKIIKLSAAIIIDGSYKYEDDKKVYIERSPEEIKSLASLIKSAIGFQEDRGDVISVKNIPFITEESLIPPESKADAAKRAKEERWKRYLDMAKYALYPLSIIFIFLFLLRPLFRVVTEAHQPLPSPSLEESRSFTLEDAEKASAPRIIRKGRTLDEAENEAEAMVDADLEVTPERMKSKVLKKKVVELVNRDPKGSAMLIRSWISEK